MQKIIVLLLASSLTLSAMSYKSFKKHVLKNSKILQSKQLSVQAVQEESNILLRPSNPNLELEGSHFDPDLSRNAYGYSVGISQNIRTGSYFKSLQNKADANRQLAYTYMTQGRAAFIRELETLYTNYVYQEKLLTLLHREYSLSKRISSIVKEQYQNGSQTKVEYLKTKTQALTVKTEIFQTEQKVQSIYYALLGLAGINKKVSLQKTFIYPVSSRINKSSKASPSQKILEAKAKVYESDLQVNNRVLKSFNLKAGIEKEPDQSILRIGVSIPLPFFDQNREERALAMIKMQQAKLDQEQLLLSQETQKKALHHSIRSLSEQYHTLKNAEAQLKELMGLLEEGYRIAKGSLFELLETKNKLIQTRKMILETQKELNTQRITLNYLKGKYNE